MSLKIIGQKAAPGMVHGPIFIFKKGNSEINRSHHLFSDFDPSKETLLFEKALYKSLQDLENLKNKFTSIDKEKIDIIEVHQSLIDDPEVKEQTLAKINHENKFAYVAYEEVISLFKNMFSEIEDSYLKQRVLDLEDISNRVLFYIINPELNFSYFSYSQLNDSRPSIIISEDLTPSDILGFEKTKVLGFVLSKGSPQSHSSILARSMEIPCLVGAHELETLDLSKYTDLILDTENSEVILNPNINEVKSFEEKVSLFKFKQKQLFSFKGKKTETKMGKLVPLGANISGPLDIDSVIKNDAEFIGLYRTEFLFLDRITPPSEEEQYETYRTVFQYLGHKRIIIRTLDIGGDKEAPYIRIQKEENPFLGVRGIRLCLKEIELFKTQLRAILRASNFCNDLGIMFPMVSTISEIKEAKKIFNTVKTELEQSKIQIGKKINIGVMMEVPSLAWILKEVSDEVTFISIGTNDLFQYSNACDRMNNQLQTISSPTHEGFQRFLKFIVQEAKKNQLHVGVCGSIAHHPEIMPYLISIGVDELSMTAQNILTVRAQIADL
ncbi:MAG: phosphoenolpyruvate--protein phosphotransferase [Bdellovibrionaceae bacterium]|nr:phosphoenolpyruvate--protein phosphotransferase [Pseudobdellovibrionaceae bacterium]NUM59862.1 phosphoenolpyruvate--protein phosphotransferase [Pseudobdellovibrionaceae bacterium]